MTLMGFSKHAHQDVVGGVAAGGDAEAAIENTTAKNIPARRRKMNENHWKSIAVTAADP